LKLRFGEVFVTHIFITWWLRILVVDEVFNFCPWAFLRINASSLALTDTSVYLGKFIFVTFI
jgi:hypothetical protein